MPKKKFAARPWMFPKPALLVGALVKGRPNFMTIANGGIANYDPAMVAIACDKDHYTCRGIRQNQSFSVNFPSAALARVTDYAGLHHGDKVDKSNLFRVFFGELKTAPMIEECPVCMECELVQTLDLGDELFIGRVVAIYADEKCLTGGMPDIKKIDPIIYSTADKKYYRLGAQIGKAYSMGRDLG